MPFGPFIPESFNLPSPRKTNSSGGAGSCEDVNCGEGGCVIENGTAVCKCVPALVPPSKDLRCRSTLQAFETPVPPGVPHQPAKNGTASTTPDSGHTASQQASARHLLAMQITVPLIGMAIIGAIVCALLVQRRRQTRQCNQRQSPVSWVSRQDKTMLLDNMPVSSKNPHYYAPGACALKHLEVTHIASDSLSLHDVIGEGAFGKVYKGDVRWSEDNTTDVAVKILKEDATRETQQDFTREVEIMASFDHENILKLIGIVAVNNSSPYMVFEYMDHGDLAELLRSNDAASGRNKTIRLKQTDLIDIATQVANGMLYLTSQHFVHRDLATRNCLVGAELVVKISDFGMSRDIYTCDYYKIGGTRMLPVRWMSPESVKYGRFTTESDVWAYGVVLWEIFSYGKQPYYGHSNEEVIRFIDDNILLQRPGPCPATIYHVMLGCWRRDSNDRFTFKRIYHVLVDYGRKMMKCYHKHNLQNVAEYDEV